MNDNNKLFLIIIALLALIVCSFVWLVASRDNAAELYSETGVWDFRGLFAGDDSYWLSGPVEYIPNALLNPDEFAEREGEARIGQPHDVSQYATSRLRLLMPDDGYYTFYGRSIDYAYRLFVNGELILETGSPGRTKETNIPGAGMVSLRPKNVIDTISPLIPY